MDSSSRTQNCFCTIGANINTVKEKSKLISCFCRPLRVSLWINESMDPTLRTTNLIQPFCFLHEEHEAQRSSMISQISPSGYIYYGQPIQDCDPGRGCNSQFIVLSATHTQFNLTGTNVIFKTTVYGLKSKWANNK